MFGWFRKKKKIKPIKQMSMTESLILQMVAEGMTVDEIQAAFPDVPRKDLEKTIKQGLNRLGMFLDH